MVNIEEIGRQRITSKWVNSQLERSNNVSKHKFEIEGHSSRGEIMLYSVWRDKRLVLSKASSKVVFIYLLGVEHCNSK